MRLIPSRSSASAISGLWFIFSQAGDQIAFWCSAFTAKEQLFVNGELVSESRSMRFHSQHEFEIDREIFRVKVSVVGLLKSKYECELSKNDQSVALIKIRYVLTKLQLGSFFFLVAAGFLSSIEFTDNVGTLLAVYGLGIFVGISFLWSLWKNGWVIDEVET